ncbi:Wzz/FepE/Etk N-terminal domain-containing protein [bacterium]|nr:Wzz/FepE/Etk N-terminal domain-containing protein [bacterium]
MSENKEIEIRDIIITLKEIKQELISRSFKIGLFVFLFSLTAVLINFFQDSRYKAELSFVVEDKQKSTPLSSVSGLASQFGFDFFSSSNTTFSQANIMELLKSRGVISKTLLRSNNKNLFIQNYISMYNLDSDWKNNKDLKGISFKNQIDIKHDSIITMIWEKIIYLSFKSKEEKFAKLFSENLIDEMSSMYIEYQTKQSTNTIDFLQNRADSVFNELEKAEEEFARVKDINQRIIKASGRLKELQLMRSVEVLSTMYLELIKNIEISKLTLLNQTPIIQVIDRPTLPLEDTKLSTFLVFFISFVLSFLISVFYFVFRKMIVDSLK